MAKKSFVKINIRGGIISSGELDHIVTTLQKSGVENVELGERQNLYFYFDKRLKEQISLGLTEAGLDFEIDSNQYPNIVSSYAANDIFSTHNWLSEGMYRDILSSFTYRPKIKINIVDNTQALVPLYTGCLNFIPSTHVNFYYLFINHPLLDGLKSWNKLIYCTEIPTLSKLLEDELITTKEPFDLDKIQTKIEAGHKMITMDMDVPLTVPRLRFPYYEGMNKFGDKVWLGIYRRDNDFSTSLLESIQILCSLTKIGQINLTSWRSIMIKGIAEQERIEWEKLLSKHGINTRHSSLELNWQFPDLDKEAMRIKNALVKNFDDLDIRTYGISFGIDTGKPFDSTSPILIKKRRGLFKFWGPIGKLTMYDILYSRDFNLNTTQHIYYTENIAWNGLALNLRNLCGNFYKQLSKNIIVAPKKVKEEKTIITDILYQCKHCLTVYSEKHGDPEKNIPKGTLFELVPENYTCPLCESPKSDFIKIDTEIFVS